MAVASTDRLLWRCRRGMKELDLLLERFARERYEAAPPQRQRAFERLLELPDPVLAGLLLGPVGPAGAGADTAACTAAASGIASLDGELAELAALVAGPGRR